MLTYSGGTYRAGELSYDCSVSKDLTQMVNLPTQIQDNPHSLSLLEIFLSSGSSIFETWLWWIFEEMPVIFSTKVSLLYLLYSTARKCCLLHLIKQTCLLKTFLKILILMIQVLLYMFPLLELIWICIIFLKLPRWLKKVITNLDMVKASGSDCITAMVLKNGESELLYILSHSSISFGRNLVFDIVGRFHWWFLYLRLLGKCLQLKTTQDCK